MMEPSAAFAARFVSRLNDADADTRRESVDALGVLGARVLLGDQTDGIVERLADEEESVRLASTRVLGELLGPAELERLMRSDLAPRFKDRSAAVRRAAVMVLQKLEPQARSRHSNLAAECLADEDSAVREAALVVLGTLSPQVLASHASAIVERVEDNDRIVRLAAVKAIGGLEPSTLVCYAPLVAQHLEDEEVCFHWAAVVALGQLPHWALAEHAEAISSRFEHSDPAVREIAVKVLGKLEADQLSLHASDIAALLTDDAWQVRLAAVMVLTKESMPEHLGAVMQRLQDDHTRVQWAVIDAISDMQPSALLPSAQYLLGLLSSNEHSIRRAAEEVVYKLPAKAQLALEPGTADAAAGGSFAMQAEEFHYLPHRETLLHVAARHRLTELAEELASQYEVELINARNDAHNTPLHIAASIGSLELCQCFVQHGAIVRMKNGRKRTAEQLAIDNGHDTVAIWLSGHTSISAVRGGAGDALAEALADRRPIQSLEWYIMPMVGLPGALGVKHSLLRVQVGDSRHRAHAYVIEKASVRRRRAKDPVLEQLENGVYISHWEDVRHNLEDAPIFSLYPGTFDSRISKTTLADLRKLLVKQGPYDVGRCNCHHAALAVFNYCADESCRVAGIPNKFQSQMARVLSAMGVDVVRTESESLLSSVPRDGAPPDRPEVTEAAAALAQAGSEDSSLNSARPKKRSIRA